MKDAVRFETFAKHCAEKGLQAKECSIYHWQVLGGKFLVNYFHGRRGSKVYIGQTARALPGGDDLAIACANFIPGSPLLHFDGRRKPAYTKYKRRMFKKSNLCAICETPMTYEEATVDHIIPLSRGGLDHHNNYQLAHERCNQNKGNRI